MRKCELALAIWGDLAKRSEFLLARTVGQIECSGWSIGFPSYTFLGPSNGGEAIRIGLFAGIHGDEPAGTHGLGEFISRLNKNPELAAGYQLFCYPVCNPSGFTAGTRTSCRGKDLNREFWKHSSEPEVVILENEIQAQQFHGLISLHCDDTCEGIYGFAKGAVLTRELLEPALVHAEAALPRDTRPLIDGFPAKNGVILDCYDGVLTSPPDLKPAPFEIILETPLLAPTDLQERAFVLALESILADYRKLLAFAANL